MTSKIKKIVLSLAALFILATPALVPAIASAANPNPQNSLCSGANSLTIDATGGCSGITDQSSTVNTVISDILNILSVVVGIISVIMIIIGGFHYITSAGSQEKVKKAKDTILYAIVGLIIVALAQIIVKFVLNKASGA